jgi:hypothetical protein
VKVDETFALNEVNRHARAPGLVPQPVARRIGLEGYKTCKRDGPGSWLLDAFQLALIVPARHLSKRGDDCRRSFTRAAVFARLLVAQRERRQLKRRGAESGCAILMKVAL